MPRATAIEKAKIYQSIQDNAIDLGLSYDGVAQLQAYEEIAKRLKAELKIDNEVSVGFIKECCDDVGIHFGVKKEDNSPLTNEDLKQTNDKIAAVADLIAKLGTLVEQRFEQIQKKLDEYDTVQIGPGDGQPATDFNEM